MELLFILQFPLLTHSLASQVTPAGWAVSLRLQDLLSFCWQLVVLQEKRERKKQKSEGRFNIR